MVDFSSLSPALEGGTLHPSEERNVPLGCKVTTRRKKRRRNDFQKLIEYHNRALRKKSREIKRNKARRVRREKHAQLKRTVKEAKANGTLTKELKKAWLDEKEKVFQRNVS